MAFRYASVGAAIFVALAQPPTPGSEQLEPITDPAAYEVYATVVPLAWENVHPKGKILLLQEETEILWPSCRLDGPSPYAGEWKAVEDNLKQQNIRVRRLLQSMLHLNVAHRLIPRAEIEADDARLALKYPGIWQRRPESMEFVAVSAIGFDAAKTKAMVYLRNRNSGGIVLMEMLDGKWVRAKAGRCGWIA